ncbi:copper chaperone PCu(A)C [Streptomyces sp. NPDC005438]|uniref:copper chaperone PCu(A)C n=1 Tax=Streptomyces sp. NPDC005438 TaxID=3156880 RepID=UPI0033B2BE7B
MTAVRTALVGALVGVLALAGCGSEDSGDEAKAAPELSATGAYMPQPLNDEMAGGFLVLRNKGERADRLVGARSKVAGKVEIHRTVDQQMQRVKSLPVPADGELALKRGGNHLMFLDLRDKPVKGDKVTVTLRFAESRPLTVSMPVRATNHMPHH